MDATSYSFHQKQSSLTGKSIRWKVVGKWLELSFQTLLMLLLLLFLLLLHLLLLLSIVANARQGDGACLFFTS